MPWMIRTQRIPRRAVAGYAAGSVGTGGFGTLPGLVLAYYLTDTLAVPALLATLVVVVPKVWDVVIDPAVHYEEIVVSASGLDEGSPAVAQPISMADMSLRACRCASTENGIASTRVRTPMRCHIWPTAWMICASFT